jgi:hypothetical protein
MKHISLLILGLLLLIGCHSNKEKYQIGPLSQIKDFEVCYFFSPYEKFDRDLLFTTLVDCLKAIGSVEIIDVPYRSTTPKTPTLFFLSLGGYQQENKGSIEIMSSVQIEANQFRTNCSIWHRNFGGKTRVSYPVIEGGKVSFKEDEQALNISSEKKSTDDPASILKQMIANFANEYHQFNSEEEKPMFYIYSHQPI